MNIHDDIAKVSKILLFKQPFYGSFLLTLNKVVRDDVPTAGVSKNNINCQLAVNPTFWEGLPVNQREGVLLHELLHIVMFHLDIRDKFSDKKLFNIAADMEINQYIERNDLPSFAIYPDTYPELNLPLKAGTRKYYELLKKDLDQDHKSPGLQADMDAQNGTGSGNGVPGGGDIHGTWEEFDSLSEAEKELVKKQVEYQIKNVVSGIKDRGTIPGHLKDMIDKLFEIVPPIFDWKAYLRRFVGASTQIYTKKSRRKVNKRFIDFPAIKIKLKSHILVAVDTSGSVSEKELIEFYNEIHHIWKSGVGVTVAQCDADIHDFSEYTGKFDGRVHGRGGTSFQPPIDYFDKHKEKYSTLIFFTDGYASMPTKPRKQMLWVMSSNSQTLDHFKEWPGFKIRIDK